MINVTCKENLRKRHMAACVAITRRIYKRPEGSAILNFIVALTYSYMQYWQSSLRNSFDCGLYLHSYKSLDCGFCFL